MALFGPDTSYARLRLIVHLLQTIVVRSGVGVGAISWFLLLDGQTPSRHSFTCVSPRICRTPVITDDIRLCSLLVDPTMETCVASLPPTTSFAQSRLDKTARSATLLITPQPVSSSLMTSCSATYEPSTPKSATTPGTAAGDVEMAQAFVTPPQVSRVLPGVNGPGAASAPMMTKKVANALLDSPQMPMTPPLTPPFLQNAPLLPAISGLPSSPSPAPLLPKPSPPTVSARALANHPLHPLFDASYTLCEELGSGGFGFVVRAERNSDGLGVAVKFIERAKIPSHGWVKSRSWGETPGLTQAPGPKLVPMEAFVLRSVRHEGVVAFLDLFEDEKYFYLVSLHIPPTRMVLAS